MPACPHAIFVAAVVGAVACAAPLVPGQSPIAVTPIAAIRGATGPATAQTLVIADASAWATFWAGAWQGRSPLPPVPAVDFSSSVVLVAAMGQKPTGGYSIAITGAAERNGVVTVAVAETSPGAGCVTAQIVTSPIDAAVMPRRNPSTIGFQTTRIVHNCG